MPRENFVYKSGFQDFKMTRIDTRVRRNLEESDEWKDATGEEELDKSPETEKSINQAFFLHSLVFKVKETMCVNSSGLLYKDGNARFKTIPLKPLSDK